jgi:hypothetical protein
MNSEQKPSPSLPRDFRNKAFISYDHKDDLIGSALQIGLQKFAKSRSAARAMRISRDKTNLATNPDLWSSIEQELIDSEFLILLCSPESAKSHWVAREAAAFLKTSSSSRILLVLVGGELVWNPAQADFDRPATTALPEFDKPLFSSEPLYLDLRWAAHEDNLTLNNIRFRDAVADLAATLTGVAKDTLIGRHLEEHAAAVQSARWFYIFRGFLGFGLTSLALLLGLGFDLPAQAVLFLGFPAVGAVGAASLGLRRRGTTAFAIAFLIIAFTYAFGSIRPFNDNWGETVMLGTICILGFLTGGGIAGSFTRPKVSKASALSFGLSGMVAALAFIIMPGLRPHDGTYLSSIGSWDFHAWSDICARVFGMHAFWWRQPMFYLPLVLGNCVGGAVFGWAVGRASKDAPG